MTPSRAGFSPVLIWAGVLVLTLALLWLLSGVLLPFVAGIGVAYFLDPVVDRLQRRGLGRAAATSAVTILFFAAFSLLVLVLAPILFDQAVGFASRLPAYLESARAWLMPWVDRALDMVQGSDRDAAAAALGKYGEKALTLLGNVAAGLLQGGGAILSLFSLIVISPVVAFYLLRDWDRLIERVDHWLPRDHAATIRQLLGDIDRVIAGFVRGQATVCLVLAAYYGAALSLIGLDFGLAVGMATGLLSFVPVLGAGLGGLASIAIALFQFWPDWTQIGGVAAILGVGQVLEGQVLTPRLVGAKVGLHPAWVIFALLASGALFGFVGLLLAVPAFAAIAVLARHFMGRYLASELYRGLNPPSPPPSSPPGGASK